MLDVRRLRLLRELSLRGTITAVADALAFTPSAISQQLSALEREAGVPLLERSGRRVTLTPAGQNLVIHAEAILERLEQATAELVDTRRGLAGPLRIGTFPTATRAIVLPALTELAERHPHLEPMVVEIDPAPAAAALRAGELDVALLHEYDFVPARHEPGLTSEPLCTESMYLASTSPPQKPALRTWQNSPWIASTQGTLCHAMTIRACEAEGFTPQVRHQVDDFDVALALVASGQGVALIPELVATVPPADVILTRLPIHRHTKIAFRSGAALHPAVTATIAALRAALPERQRAGYLARDEHQDRSVPTGNTRP